MTCAADVHTVQSSEQGKILEYIAILAPLRDLYALLPTRGNKGHKLSGPKTLNLESGVQAQHGDARRDERRRGERGEEQKRGKGRLQQPELTTRFCDVKCSVPAWQRGQSSRADWEGSGG